MWFLRGEGTIRRPDGTVIQMPWREARMRAADGWPVLRLVTFLVYPPVDLVLVVQIHWLGEE
jgi:hypothetical protein